MRILFLGDINSPHIRKEAVQLRELGTELGIFSLSQPQIDWYSHYGINSFYSDKIGQNIFSGSLFSKFRFFSLLPEIRKVIKRFGPDIIHAHYASSYGFLGALTGFRPLIITLWGSDINTLRSENRFRNFIVHLLSNTAILRAAKVLPVSRNLTENIWWRKGKVEVIPSGVDTQIFRPLDKTACRKSLGWPDEEKVILFFANNPVVKRLDIARETVGIIRERFPGVRLEVLDGSVFGEEAMSLRYNASDCLLICSDSEGSPSMVKEALACNLPIVGVDVGDIAERLKGVEQCRIAPQNPHYLSDAIFMILESGKASGGRAKIMGDGLSLPQVTRKIYKVYEQFAKQRKNEQ